MDPAILRAFKLEVERQCSFATIAARDLENALRDREMDRVWYSIQSILVAAGNISKLLWPQKSKIPDRGSELRANLSVSDDSPLQPRIFRNHFEHFDDRLEEWATSSTRRNFVDSNVGPIDMIRDIDPGDYLRNFNPATWTVTFRGDSYELKPIIQEVGKILKNS